MKKQAYLQKLLVKEGAVALGAVVAGLAIMAVLGGLASNAVTELQQARAQLNNTNAQLATLRGQIEKSGSAEKRYFGIRASRDQEDYAPDNELVRDRLRILTDKYRLSKDLKLTLSPETEPTIREFSALNYTVNTRENMALTFSAMSDVHALSFLSQFYRSMPGIIRLTKLNLTRTGDLNVGALSQMTAGAAPELVDVEMEFLWATLRPKNTEGTLQ